MYATLSYKANWTVANAISDITKILTGETNKANLSTDIEQTGTSIVSTVAAGWTLHDNVSATRKILRAPISDDGTKFKYISIESGTANTVIFEAYKSWNEGTDTGVKYKRYNGVTEQTASSYNSANVILYHSSAAASTVCISSSSTHFAASCNSGLANPLGLVLYTEHTRTNPWDTVANGYPPICQTPLNFSGSIQNSTIAWKVVNKMEGLINNTTNYDLSVTHNARCNQTLSHSYASYSSSGSTYDSLFRLPATIYGADKTSTFAMVSLGIFYSDEGTTIDFGGEISSKCGVYIIARQGNFNDVLTQGGNNYRVWPGAYNVSFAVRER